MRAERATIRVGGRELADWVSYDVDSNIVEPADSYTFSIGPVRKGMVDLVPLAEPCEILVCDVVQLTGYIEGVDVSFGKGESEIVVRGRDKAGQLLDCAAPLLHEDLTLSAAAEKLGGPWITSWAVTNDLNRKKVLKRAPGWGRDQANIGGQNVGELVTTSVATPETFHVQVAPGETCWEVLDRLARKDKKLLWIAADGTGVIAKPRYDQPPSYRLVRYASPEKRGENNVVSASISRSLEGRFSEVTIRGGHGDEDGSDGGERIKVTVTDPDLDAVLHRPTSLEDGSVKTRARAEALANRTMQLGTLRGQTYEYTVFGHGQGEKLWTIDTTVEVFDELAEIDQILYVAGRRFTKSKNEGTQTVLTLIPKGALLP